MSQEEKKYEFTGEERKVNAALTLKQIRRISDGQMGGWIESERNLSHDGECWVYDDAIVCGNALVCGNAQVFSHSTITESAHVFGNAIIKDNAFITGHSRLYGDCVVTDFACIYGSAEVYGHALISGKAIIYGHAKVFEDANISGDAQVSGSAYVYGNAVIDKDGVVKGAAYVSRVDRVTKPVLYFSLPKHDVTITDNHIRIGCEYYSIDYWLKHGEEIGLDHNYGLEMVMYYKKVIYNALNKEHLLTHRGRWSDFIKSLVKKGK